MPSRYTKLQTRDGTRIGTHLRVRLYKFYIVEGTKTQHPGPRSLALLKHTGPEPRSRGHQGHVHAAFRADPRDSAGDLLRAQVGLGHHHTAARVGAAIFRALALFPKFRRSGRRTLRWCLGRRLRYQAWQLPRRWLHRRWNSELRMAARAFDLLAFARFINHDVLCTVWAGEMDIHKFCIAL